MTQYTPEQLLTLLEYSARELGASDEELYDFTRCIRPDGSTYGSRGKCKKGTVTSAKESTSKIARQEKVSPKEKNRIEVNIGTQKWPFMVPSSSGGHVHGFNPDKDGTVRHKGEDYTATGKRGTNIKTGEPSQEYRTYEDKRIYITNSGKVYED